jgi:hypothetical protein
MIRKLSIWICQKSTGKIVVLALGVFTLFLVVVLPVQTRSGTDSAGTPDLSFCYTVDDLYRMAEAYGAQGRQEYVRVRFTFDLVWPLVYGFFMVTAVSWLFVKAFPIQSVWQRVNLIPALGVIFDYLENISTSVVMARYPARTAGIDLLATVFTPVKWTLVGLGFVLLLVGLVLVIWSRFQKR